MDNVTTINFIADFFTLSIAWSLVLFSPIASSELTGAGLIKLLSNTAAGALFVSMIIGVGGVAGGINIWFFLKAVGLLGIILTSSLHQDKKSPAMWLLYFSLSLLLPFILLFQFPLEFTGKLFVILSSLLLGVIIYSMLLGHWYLVVPKLSAEPLKRAALITWALLAVKLCWSGYSLALNYEFFEEQTTLGAGYAFNWTLLLMRLSFGYLVIGGMSYFNWKLLQLRSIQSSTGILYAMTFFVFIGELVSIYLFKNYGLFI